MKKAKGGRPKTAKTILGMVLFMLAVGLFLILDISIIEAKTNFGDSLYFVKRQLVWIVIGFAISVFLAKISLEKLGRLSAYIWIASIIFLILVLIPNVGTEIWGAKRWLIFGGVSFQPSELAKLATLIYLSFTLSRENKEKLKSFLLITAPILFLVVIEPDFGTTVILAITSLSIYFASGGGLKKLFGLILAVLFLGVILVAASPYRQNRVKALIDPFYDPLGSSYHSYQTVLTLTSGGMWGQGIGGSRQKYQYLPQVTTDSIMAVVGEELGFIGLAIFTGGLLFLVFLCFKIAAGKTDPLAKLVAGGTGAWIATQGLINLSSTAILFPFTGVPFPFISYGGSSLLSIMAAVGLVLNIEKNRQ